MSVDPPPLVVVFLIVGCLPVASSSLAPGSEGAGNP
jgi:hypothetical protein